MHFNKIASFKTTIIILSHLVFALILTACGNSEDAKKLKDALAIEKEISEVERLDITSLELSSPNTIIEFDATEQFTAEAIIGDGSTEALDYSSKVRWSVSNTDTASINSTGLLTGKADGLVTVMIQFGNLVATKDIDLSSATLTSINIIDNPSPVSVCKSGYELSAEGAYSDATTRDITSLVTWSSDDQSTLTIDEETGEFSTSKDGSAIVTAARNSLSGTDTVIITDDINSITISSAENEVDIDSTLDFSATGTYDDASTADVTNTVEWSSDDEAKLTISNNTSAKGIATGVAVGTANISATCLSTSAVVSNEVSISIEEAPVINGVSINEGVASLRLKLTDSPEQLTLNLSRDDGSLSTDVTDDDNTTWRVDDTISGTPLSISNIKGDKGEITFTEVGVTRVAAVYNDSDSDLGILENTILVEVVAN